MDEKIVMLDESDLDDVVGGFNQEIAIDMGLQIKRRSAGPLKMNPRTEYLVGHVTDASGSRLSRSSIITNGTLKKVLNNDDLSLFVKMNSGEMKKLSKDDITRLLS